MKKSVFFFFAMILVTFIASCNRSENVGTLSRDAIPQTVDEDSSYVDREFVFQGADSIEDGFVYVKYIPVNQLKPESKVVTAEYVRYHNSDSIGIVFARDYIRKLCLSSRCVYREKQDSLYGTVREYYFPEVYMGFAYDEWEEMPVYSFIHFADDLWYSDIDKDGISVTSDLESALWDLLNYASDSVQASAKVYRHDEKSGIALDHVNVSYFNVWDIIRNFYSYPMYDGLRKHENQRDFIVYMNESGLTFVKSIESDNDHLMAVYFAGYSIEDPKGLEVLESCFMADLDQLPIRDDDFVPNEP